jgi:hypothetical protein
VISARTVFVLGAGASQPYGLPLGGELYNLVLSEVKRGSPGLTHLTNTTPHNERDVDQFISALRQSGLYSVDAFLERRPEFMDIGKSAMAVLLVQKENPDALWGGGDNWLQYLYNRMIGSSLEEFTQNQVSFVTFNYDRSVEMFLATSLANAFGKSIEQVATVLNEIPIIHLHGRLGYLPWQNASEGRPYNGNIDQRVMDICRSEIKVVHEDITDRDKDFSKAKELLGNAQRVYLLGFGFGAKNTERLGLSSLSPQQFQGTAVGQRDQELNNSKNLCGRKIVLHPNHASLEFLRTVAPID